MSLTGVESAAGYRVPGHGRGLLDVIRYRYLLVLLVRQGIKVRYRGSVLGWTWSYVKPAMQFVVYYLAFGVILGVDRGIENFAVYLFSGLIVVNLFSEAFGNATRSIVENSALVKKIYLPRELFPIASVIIAVIHFLPQLVILVLGSILFGWQPNLIQLLGVILGVIIIVVLASGVGLMFGAFNVSFRDAENFVDLFLLLATWTSPVFYSWSMVAQHVPEWLLNAYLATPLPAAVELFHNGFWYPTTTRPAELPPELWTAGFVGLGLSILVLALGQYLFRRLEGRFAQIL
jgi:ABC-2 type transport system permease protein